MAKKAQPARTPPRIIWGLIDAELTAQAVSRVEIAKRIGVHVNTVHMSQQLRRLPSETASTAQSSTQRRHNMKQKTADRITLVLLAIGTAIVCAYNDILAGVILLTAFIGIVAVLWVRFIADVLADEADERAEELAQERFEAYIDSTDFRVDEQRYIGLGKGYK